ncbi:MAG TPA: protealysin inhibitor emfourin [Candidatus Methanoperedens sp.]
MLIQLERTGGFGGIRKKIILDTGSLPPEEAKKFQELVETAGFFGLPSGSRTQPKGQDRFQYRLSVETGKKKHSVEMGESSVPSALRPLLKSLEAYEK